MLKKTTMVLLLVLVLLTQMTCDKDNPTEIAKNIAPIIASLTATPTSVLAEGISKLIVIAVDSDGDELAFSWTATGGQFVTDASKDTVSWQAPDSAGTYTCTVNVSDGEDEVTKSISLTVDAKPAIGVDTTFLDFGSSETLKTFKITNTGSGILSWNISDDTDWVTVDPTSGQTEGEADNVTVSVDRAALAIGVHTGMITIVSEYDSATVEVSVQIDPQPELAISENLLDFGSDLTSLNFTISNTGTGTLDWTIADDQTWLNVNPTSGATITETETITATVDRSGLSIGTHSGLITVYSNADTSTIDVSVTIDPEPELLVSETSLDFGLAETSLTFNIQNPGTGALDWTITDNQSWLTVTPASGQTETETDVVTVTVSRDGLSGGTYNGTITIASNGGDETIAVTMTVEDPPVLYVNPRLLDFSVSLTVKTFQIENTGDGTLDWTLTENESWLTINVTSGQTQTETDIISVTVSREGLDPGTYTGTISVTSNGGNSAVTVTMEVEAVPELTVTPKSLDFGTTDTYHVFQIRNTGTGTLSWSLSDNQTWITLSQISGTTQTETDNITVTVDRTGMCQGTYTGTITVNSNGGYETISVSLEGNDSGPDISVAPLNLNFQESFTSLTSTIRNLGCGTLDWNVSESLDWVSVSPVSGSTTTEADNITVTVDRSSFVLGETKTGEIQVTSNGGDKTINVSATRAATNIIFSENFSGTLTDWTNSFCSSWISSGEAHVDGSTYGYYGTMYHTFYPTIKAEYTIEAKLARVDYASSSDYYGLYTKIDDSGTIAIPYLWFTIWPNGGTSNWAVLAFLSAGYNSQWVLLASDSQGNSSLINTGTNQWNNVSWTIETDYTLTVKIDGVTLYQTDEISALASQLGRTIDTDLARVGVRTLYDFEVKTDDIIVKKPGGSLAGSAFQPVRSQTGDKNSKDVRMIPELPKNLDKIPTIQEVLKNMRK